MEDLVGRIVVKIRSGAGDYKDCYMKIGDRGKVLEYDLDRSRVYIKGENFGCWEYIHSLKFLS